RPRWPPLRVRRYRASALCTALSALALSELTGGVLVVAHWPVDRPSTELPNPPTELNGAGLLPTHTRFCLMWLSKM
ncbi:MAG: hypothetical protein ACXVFO_07525, partial [Solirubrobacteraceae bacterium]